MRRARAHDRARRRGRDQAHHGDRTGAGNDADAELAAFAIADSPLVKTAVFGRDANWGRVAMAIGKSGCVLDAEAFDITFAGIGVCTAGPR